MKLGAAGSVSVAYFLIEEHCPTCTLLQIFTKLTVTLESLWITLTYMN